jgi:hypothetical protein
MPVFEYAVTAPARLGAAGEVVSSTDVIKVTYTRRLWRSAHKEWAIYAPPEMTDGEVMDRLLACYTPQHDERAG